MRVQRSGVTVLGLVVASVWSGAGALGQIVGPANQPPAVPPKFTPKPVEVTPPSRPLPEFRPVEAGFDPVERDASGRVVASAWPPDYAVFEAFARSLGAEEPAFRQRWAGALAERAVYQESLLIDEIPLALSLRQSLPELRSTKSLERVQELAKLTRQFMAVPGMLTELTDAGRFGEEAARKLRAAVSVYRAAVSAPAVDAVADQDPKTRATESSRQAVLLNTMEPVMILDRLLARAGRRWDEVKPSLALTPEQVARLAPHEQKLSACSTDAARADAMAELVTEISGQQKTMLLEAVRTRPGEVPADR